ncbi:hypothetical protein [Streptomyces sp. NPDC014006]|uniref:hypothetical protein n=1 Tax=Streptomyces sp. NPDC014006 TaxID=3364870 RepID=UPI0036F64D9C
MAEALHFLGAWLAEAGRLESAAAAAHEAVALLRGRGANPSQREDRTRAMALTVLGTHLMRLGRRAEGIAAAQEAAHTARLLLPADPSRKASADDAQTYVVAATAFGNLGLHLRGEGRHHQAVVVTGANAYESRHGAVHIRQHTQISVSVFLDALPGEVRQGEGRHARGASDQGITPALADIDRHDGAACRGLQEREQRRRAQESAVSR